MQKKKIIFFLLILYYNICNIICIMKRKIQGLIRIKKILHALKKRIVRYSLP